MLAQQLLWVHHPAFATEPGSTIDLPGGSRIVVAEGGGGDLSDLMSGGLGAWPHAPGLRGEEVSLATVPDHPTERLCYLTDLTEHWVGIRNPVNGWTVGMAWDSGTFPHAWFWQQIRGQGFPWFGRAQLTAIEPASAWPADGLAANIERGRSTLLDGGGQLSSWLTVALRRGATKKVQGVSRSGAIDFDEGLS
jgi:hypothetical protein